MNGVLTATLVGADVIDNTLGTKLAITVQLAVTAAVVNTLPASVPPQVPVTVPTENNAFGVSVNWAVPFGSTDCAADGLMLPLPLDDGVTVKHPFGTVVTIVECATSSVNTSLFTMRPPLAVACHV